MSDSFEALLYMGLRYHPYGMVLFAATECGKRYDARLRHAMAAYCLRRASIQ